METPRLFLFAGLAVVLMMIWQAWQKDYGVPATPVAQSPPTEAVTPPGTREPDVPGAPAASPGSRPAQKQPGAMTNEIPAESRTVQSAGRIHVRTDVYDIVIDNLGGDIRTVDLLAYPKDTKVNDQPFRLMNDKAPDLFFTQTGLLSARTNSAPNHHSVYKADGSNYRLADGADELKVRLYWRGKDGITVTKVYTFHRNSYVIGLDYEVNNDSAADWRGSLYRQFQRTPPSSQPRFIRTYTGAVISNNENPYEKIKFDDMEDANLNMTFKGGWAAMIQHYFVAAWLAQPDEINRYYTKALGNQKYIIGMASAETTLSPGQQGQLHARVFVGPKLQDRLEAVAPHLELTVDYGWLTIIAKPVFWALENINKVVNNWGWAILIVTLIIKLLFYKLSEMSYKSMANMKRVAPRLKALKERYGDDKQALNKAMMDIYKREKINPLGGCLPVLVQIPVFISLYWVLLESVEMRQAEFIFWLNDLSAPDPYFVLPLLMGATMIIQQKLNPAPMDPIQQKVMGMLPIVFTVFFAFFPSGLVLYWVANNVLSITQQWIITRRIAPPPSTPDK